MTSAPSLPLDAAMAAMSPAVPPPGRLQGTLMVAAWAVPAVAAAITTDSAPAATIVWTRRRVLPSSADLVAMDCLLATVL